MEQHQTTNTKTDRAARKEAYIGLALAAAVFLLWVVFGWWLPGAVSHDKNEPAGLLGDSFGVVNSLFSGLALGGVVYAIFLQRKELQLQRKELELTRQELKRSAKAQEASERASTGRGSPGQLAQRADGGKEDEWDNEPPRG